MASSKSKKKRPKSPVRPHARSKTIVVTVALYGPNDTLATKLVAAFIAKWNPRVVRAPETLIGCPHEEGTDYPDGGVCPLCEFWKGRDRFTGKFVQ